MSRHQIGDVLGLLFIVALVFVLVRPSSIAPALVTEFGKGLAGLIAAATEG